MAEKIKIKELPHRLEPYSHEYKEQCFVAWYSAGRPKKTKLWLEATPEDEFGRKPPKQTLQNWRNEGWVIRADELDAQASMKVDEALVSQKVIMLKKQAKLGAKLQEMGMEYLEDHGFDSSSSAVSAITSGVRIEQESRGLSETVRKVASMNSDEISENVAKLLGRLSHKDAAEIIDVDPVPDKEEE